MAFRLSNANYNLLKELCMAIGHNNGAIVVREAYGEWAVCQHCGARSQDGTPKTITHDDNCVVTLARTIKQELNSPKERQDR